LSEISKTLSFKFYNLPLIIHEKKKGNSAQKAPSQNCMLINAIQKPKHGKQAKDVVALHAKCIC
jgi:hypothetical protein